MTMADKNLMLYVAVAVVVAIVIAFAIYGFAFPGSYSVKVSMRALNPSTMYPYNTSRLLIQVNNTGSAAVRNLVVGLYLNGTEIVHYTVTIPAHQGVSLNYNYTYTGSGSYGFQAIADPGKLLSISNRSSAQGILSVAVGVPEVPNVFKSVPNGNVTAAQSFSITGTGLYTESAITQAYSLRVVDNIFSPSKTFVARVFDNVYGYIANGFGASVNYTNGASAYAIWLQGTVSPGLIGYVASTFRLPQANVSVNGNAVGFVKTGNQTSMCTYYGNGWTKIVVYSNNSRNMTCLSIIGRVYVPTEANVLVGAINTSNVLTKYQLKFAYSNSTELGTSLLYSNGSIGVMNLFQGTWGVAASVIQRQSRPLNASAQIKCLGLIYTVNNTQICSFIAVPSNRGTQQGFGLVNSTEFTRDYTVSIYALVNSSQLLAAHYNAAALIGALKLNESSIPFVPAFKSFCRFNNTPSIGCGFSGFNYLNNTASLNITNMLARPIKINNVRCSVPGVTFTSNVVTTIGSDANMIVRVPCENFFFPTSVLVTSYNLTLNYTYNNATKFAIGFLNVTTAGFH